VNFDWGLLAAPFVAGLLVLAIHVPLGLEVLRRGIIFIDLAVAQVAALGVIVAGLAGWESAWATQAAAAVAALAGAALLTWSERRWPDIQEALIGLLFVTAAAAGILLLANNPQGGEHLKDLLAGQILWVGWPQLLPVAVLYALLLAALGLSRPYLERTGFYVVFALAVTASVQLVGVLLVFASLIAPALAARGRRRPRLVAFGFGALAYGFGLLASAAFDWPAGAAVVCVASVGAVASLLVTGPLPTGSA
jgi:zinc/manganese transport system permease protein